MKETIKIAVCDDQEADRQTVLTLIAAYLDQNNLYALIDTYASGEALLAADISSYNLVILDIFMAEMNGMETAKALIEKNNRLQIVFATTSLEFAAEAFEIEALHYIVKPIEKKQFYRVLDKFFEGYTSVRTVEVKVGRLEESVYISDILYIEAKGKKTLLHLKNGTLETSESLSEMAELLPKEEFCQPIRWALVSMKRIRSVSSVALTLEDQTEIPISRGKREEIKKAFADFKWMEMRRKMRGR